MNKDLGFLEEQGLCPHSTAQLYCDIVDSYLSGQTTEKQMWSELGGRGRASSTITRALGKCPLCKAGIPKHHPKLIVIPVEGSDGL